MSKDYAESYQSLTFTNDFLFCKILENNPELSKELLEVILGVKIRKVEIVNKQKEIKLQSDGKGVRFDVYVEDANNSVYDIEMQTVPKGDLPKRSRYYQGMIDMDMIQKGAKYSELKKSYVIFICTFDPFGINLPVYRFSNVCSEDKGVGLDDETWKIFLNSTGTKENVSGDLKAFLEFLEGKNCENAFVKKLQKEVENAKSHEEWRHEYMTLEMRDEEKRQEGRQEERQRAIVTLVITLRELNQPDDIVVKQLMSKYKLTEAEAKAYL